MSKVFRAAAREEAVAEQGDQVQMQYQDNYGPILLILRNRSSLPFLELMVRSRLDADVFQQAITEMEEQGLIQRSDPADTLNDIVKLNAKGRELAAA